jgi:hypothetical protein
MFTQPARPGSRLEVVVTSDGRRVVLDTSKVPALRGVRSAEVRTESRKEVRR